MLERSEHTTGLTVLEGINVGEMVDAIAPGLAFENSMDLRVGLWRRLVVRDQIGAVVTLPAGGALLVPYEGRVKLTRDDTLGRQVIRLSDLLKDDPVFGHLYWRELTSAETLDRAFAMVYPIYHATRSFSPARFLKLISYAPLIEKIAYKHVTEVSLLLDRARPQIIENLEGGSYQTREIVAYWQAARIMGVLTLVASDPGARSWLVELSKQFRWKTWTPTFRLVRERSTGLALAAAHSAIAFGPDAFESYGRMLGEAEHPLRAFDALYGICAIARGSADLADDAIAMIELARRKHLTTVREHVEYFGVIYDNALSLLQQLRNGDLPRRTKEGEYKSSAILSDPASYTGGGRPLAFQRLETMGSIESTFRQAYAPSSQRQITERAIIQWFHSTWAPQKGRLIVH